MLVNPIVWLTYTTRANVMNEEILGTFPGLIQRGFMKVWNCMLVSTTTGLILAKDK